MINRRIFSERLKWIFRMVAIGTGFTAKVVISYPTECTREEVAQDFVMPNGTKEISPFSSFFPQ